MEEIVAHSAVPHSVCSPGLGPLRNPGLGVTQDTRNKIQIHKWSNNAQKYKLECRLKSCYARLSILLLVKLELRSSLQQDLKFILILFRVKLLFHKLFSIRIQVPRVILRLRLWT